MVDINSTLPLIGPVSSTVSQILNFISVLVGGIFGIYVITLIIRVIFFKKMYSIYEDLKSSLERIESKLNKLGRKK